VPPETLNKDCDAPKDIGAVFFFVRDAKSGESMEEPKMLSFNSSDLLKIGFGEKSCDLVLPPWMVDGGGPCGVKELDADGGAPLPKRPCPFAGVDGGPKLKLKAILCGEAVGE
jgi:hypothetical protein